MEPIIPLLAGILLIVLIVALFVMAMWFATCSTKAGNILGATCTFLFCLCMAALLIGTCKKKPTGRNQYECLIDDEMPYTEIYDKYDVVDRRGEIWILEDKDE